jgi:hypothetical protein
MDCLGKFMNGAQCDSNFPCLYDCFVSEGGKASATTEPDKRQSSPRPAFNLQSVFDVFGCLTDCAKTHPISNWRTFAQLLYCMIDDCICYKLFPSEKAKKRQSKSKKGRKG